MLIAEITKGASDYTVSTNTEHAELAPGKQKEKKKQR